MADQIALPPVECGECVSGVPISNQRKKRKTKGAAIYCDICEVTCNSSATYEMHISGQRHRKKLAAVEGSAGIASTGVQQASANKPDLADFESTINYLTSLAEMRSIGMAFTVLADEDPYAGNERPGGQCEVELAFGDASFRAQGTSVEEAQHLASLMAIQSIDLSVPPVQRSRSPSPVSQPKRPRVAVQEDHFVPPPAQITSGTVAGKLLASTVFLPTSEEVDRFVQKHLVGPHNVKLALEGMLNHVAKGLTAAARAICTHYHSCGRPREVDAEMVPPHVLNPMRLLSAEEDPHAKLLWAVMTAPHICDLVNVPTSSARLTVLCARQTLHGITAEPASGEDYVDVLDVADSKRDFVKQVGQNMANVEVLDDRLVMRKQVKTRNGNVSLVMNIEFVPFVPGRPLCVEMRRQIWFIQHIARHKSAVKALRILLELSRRSGSDGLGLVPEYTWEVLVGLCAEVSSAKHCPTVMCAHVLAHLAGGLLLNGSVGLADPCAIQQAKWTVVDPPVAGMEDVSTHARLAITREAQRLVLDVVHPHLAQGEAFLTALLGIETTSPETAAV